MDINFSYLPRLSVVVPVFNDAKYLDECIHSILSQTYCNFEIVLVDDGSTDESSNICDRYADKYINVKTFHQENGGQNSARIKGIRESSGEYIGFVDADDWVEPNMYENLLNCIDDTDLITSGILVHDIGGDIQKKWNDNINPGIYYLDDNEFRRNIFISKSYDGNSGMPGALLNNIVCKVFRKDIIEKIINETNDKINYREDFLIVALYLLRCQKITVTHHCYYHYRYNPHSVTHLKNPWFLFDRAKEYSIILNAINKTKDKFIIEEQFKRRFLYDFLPLMIDQLDIPINLSFPIYRFPKNELIEGKRIALFGAGNVGASYYCQWKINSTVNLVLWIDNSKKGKKVFSYIIDDPDLVRKKGFDYIVCAAMDEKTAMSMKKQLDSYDIPKEKILWEKPIDTWRFFYEKNDKI